MSARTQPVRRGYRGLAAAAAGLTLLTACGSAAPNAAPGTPAAGATGTGSARAAASSSGTGTQAPGPAASNPPGDIPDTTAYVPYRPPQSHVLLKVPEGWSRQDTAASSTFSSGLNSITIAWVPAGAAPTVSSARASTVPALQRSTSGFTLQAVKAVRLAAGPAVEIIYQVNSQANAVTGKQYRLVVERFELSRGGRRAVLTLSSALGSDNVDPWRIVSESLRWV